MNTTRSHTGFQVEPARRVRLLPPYIFARINAICADRRRQGIDLIDLGMGNPTDPPEDFTIDKLAEAARDKRNHRYSPSRGIEQLRLEVADQYDKRWGVKLDADEEIVVTVGSKEGFTHMCWAMLEPGDVAIVPDPYYPAHTYGPMLAGAQVVHVPIGTDAAFLRNVEAAARSVPARQKLLILNFPHNPTAVVVGPGFYEKVVELARRCNLIVVSDLAYGWLGFDGYKSPSFLAVPGAREIGIETSSMSKTYNMPGWRVGFVAGNAGMVEALATLKHYVDYGLFTPIQIASAVTMRQGDEHIAMQIRRYESRRDVLMEGLKCLGWQAESPKAGMFVWARIPDSQLAGRTSMEFILWLIDEAEVAISPGDAFGPGGQGYVRIALVDNEDRIRQAIRNIAKALNLRKGAECKGTGTPSRGS
jgi:alanine-synthesizing transaminase